MVDLFEIQDGKVIPSAICYTSKTLKEVMKVFKKDKNYLKVYTALFYLTCPDPKRNPYIDIREDERQATVLGEVEIDFSIDEPAWEHALAFCKNLFTTPTQRFFLDCKIGLETVGTHLREKGITGDGRDSNFTAYVNTLKSQGTIVSQFLQVQKAYMDELTAAMRGGREVGYDEDN